MNNRYSFEYIKNNSSMNEFDIMAIVAIVLLTLVSGIISECSLRGRIEELEELVDDLYRKLNNINNKHS